MSSIERLDTVLWDFVVLPTVVGEYVDVCSQILDVNQIIVVVVVNIMSSIEVRVAGESRTVVPRTFVQDVET